MRWIHRWTGSESVHDVINTNDCGLLCGWKHTRFNHILAQWSSIMMSRVITDAQTPRRNHYWDNHYFTATRWKKHSTHSTIGAISRKPRDHFKAHKNGKEQLHTLYLWQHLIRAIWKRSHKPRLWTQQDYSPLPETSSHRRMISGWNKYNLLVTANSFCS